MDRYFRDEWPSMPDGSDFDGRDLFALLESGNSPFGSVWELMLLIQEIEAELDTRVLDIPRVYNGSNNYGFHIKLSDRSDIVARLARGDVNMPNYDGFSIEVQVPEVKFEAAVYCIIDPPGQYLEPSVGIPQDIAGRRLMVFERTTGEKNVWRKLGAAQQDTLLVRSADIRAALFNFDLPFAFATEWLRERLFDQKPSSLPTPVAPTREFYAALVESKVEATIKNVGGMIGWESDNNIVGPIFAAAKQSLLRLLPNIVPEEKGGKPTLYRLILEHSDFGIHNMSIMMNTEGMPAVTSLYHWETGCVVPTLLSDRLMEVQVSLVLSEDGAPSIKRVPKSASQEDLARYT